MDQELAGPCRWLSSREVPVLGVERAERALRHAAQEPADKDTAAAVGVDGRVRGCLINTGTCVVAVLHPAASSPATAAQTAVRGAALTPCTSRGRAVYRHDVSRAKAPGVAWIAEVLVSGPVAAKLRAKHGLDPDEIATLVSSPPPRLGTFVEDQRGKRLYVKVRNAAGKTVLVVLSPLTDDIWQVTSAYPEVRE
jgi:hypothetical protein